MLRVSCLTYCFMVPEIKAMLSTFMIIPVSVVCLVYFSMEGGAEAPAGTGEKLAGAGYLGCLHDVVEHILG